MRIVYFVYCILNTKFNIKMQGSRQAFFRPIFLLLNGATSIKFYGSLKNSSSAEL